MAVYLKLCLIAALLFHPLVFCNTSNDELVPLVIWPGMGDSCCYQYGAYGYKLTLERLIPGIYVKLVAFGKTPEEDSYNSFFLNTNKQVDLACQLLSSDAKLSKGFNAMGFSQGSQLLRALVQRCGLVKVHNLISLGGQHNGVYGFPFCPGSSSVLCHVFRRFLGMGTYLSFIQDHLVQAQYWHDPYDEESYALDCEFLSDINQELVFKPIYRERFSNISNFVMVKFEDDMMVEPKETEWFGFYKEHQSVETYSMFESKIYKKDLIGLKFLHDKGRIHFLSCKGGHLQFTFEWFKSHLLPYINRTHGNWIMEKATNKAQRLLQATVDGLTDDQIQGINDGLRCFEESLMTTKDRTALLQYWVSVSKRNVGFRDWLAIQLHSIDGPQVATAFEQLTTGALETCAAVHYTDDDDDWKARTDKLSNRHCIAIILCLLVGIVLVILSLTVYLPTYLSSPLPTPNVTARVLVAEEVTTVVGVYPSSSTSMLSFSEVVLKGDDYHSCFILLIPTSSLSYHWKVFTNTFNSTTIVDRFPIINYRYVYMIKLSVISFNICLGNISRSPDGVLYVFNNESQYAEYLRYSVSDTAVHSASLKVGGVGETLCTNVSFTAPSSDYYFFVMLVPLERTRYSFNVIENERYINYKDYLYNYTYCIVARDRNCSLSLSSNSTNNGKPVNGDSVTVLAYAQPNYSPGSEINHLDVMIGSGGDDRAKALLICWCLFVLGVFVLLMTLSSFIVWACFCWRRSKRVAGYKHLIN